MPGFHLESFVNALVYAVLGIFLFMAIFIVVDKISPYDLWGEIVEKNNIALAILVGLMSLGTCIIIAAAVH